LHFVSFTACFYVLCNLFDILFPFSHCLRLWYSGNKPVYLSTCLFVISSNFANIPLHWPSFSIKLLAILFAFVVSALRLDSDCTTLLVFSSHVCKFCPFATLKLTFEASDLLLVEGRESISKVFFHSFADAFYINFELFVCLNVG